jgi:hypothetical protein
VCACRQPLWRVRAATQRCHGPDELKHAKSMTARGRAGNAHGTPLGNSLLIHFVMSSMRCSDRGCDDAHSETRPLPLSPAASVGRDGGEGVNTAEEELRGHHLKPLPVFSLRPPEYGGHDPTNNLWRRKHKPLRNRVQKSKMMIPRTISWGLKPDMRRRE